ncbi:hypothetical protein MBENS4_4004 [Novosphingobium sp. MBES04]|nr:hypothetical protein MBENS4_4004 [Novosphingobium sp. MBES04]
MTLVAAWLVLLVGFASDWGAMARQWWDISTYNHMLLIPPVEVWLVWQRRSQLARLAPAAWWPGLVLAAGAAFVWLLGGVSGLDLARQAGVVALLGACVPLLLGPRVTMALCFPLFYLVFMVLRGGTGEAAPDGHGRDHHCADPRERYSRRDRRGLH